MPWMLRNIVKEIIDEESRFLEPDEQQYKKKRNPKFKVWRKKKKEKHSKKKLHDFRRENLGIFITSWYNPRDQEGVLKIVT